MECPFIIDHLQVFHDFIQRHLCIFLHVHGVNAQFDGANGLHDCLFKARADCHDFTGCLHLSAQCPLCIDKFIKCPLWVLYNDIVQSRFKASVSLAGYLVDDFIQRVPDGNSGCNLCNRVTGCLRSQCRRTGYTWIYFDNCILHAGWMQSKLTVAAALYLQLRDDVDGSGSQHLIFSVGQGNCRSDNDAVAGMNADRVEVFHGADGNDVALAVTNNFKFNFFPAADTLFNQNLCDWGEPQTVFADVTQHFFVVCNPAACTAEGECRTNDNRIVNFFCKVNRIFYSFNNLRRDTWLIDFFHGVLECLTVFCLVDGERVSPQQFDTVCFQEAFFCQLHGEGQARLTAHGGEQAVRFFNLDNPLYNVQGQRFNINLVCHCLVGHDGCRVGVDEHNFNALLLQCTASLCAGIVKFGCLSDDNRARTNYEYLFYIASQWHGYIFSFSIPARNSSNKYAVSNGPPCASGWNCTVKALIL